MNDIDLAEMSVLDAIRTRRAVRSYAPEKPSEEQVRALLDAAVQAPSAMNAQPWIFAVVEDRARLARWSEKAKALMLAEIGAEPRGRSAHYRELLSSPGFDIFYGAPALIVIGAQRRDRWSEADCWLAAENLMLAACDARLGTCCIGFAIGLLNTPEIKNEIAFPAESVAVAPIIVGRPTNAPPPVPRTPPRVLAWL